MPSQSHILVVDDDRDIRDLLARFLSKHDFRVTGVATGTAMRAALETSKVDLLILDVMLPGDDGLSLCRSVRAASGLPIVMLTAMGEDTDRIVGLEMGADDYLAKPFNPRELLARIKAILRRSGAGAETRTDKRLKFEGWTLDLARRELTAPDRRLVDLTGGEFDLLVAFAEHPQRTLSRDQLLDLTRGRSSAPFDRSIDIQVSRLRQKIEPDAKTPTIIKTVRSFGYVFAARVTSE